MERFWKFNRFKLKLAMVFAATLLIFHSFSLCRSLNTEGLALLKFRDGIERDPFGVLSGWDDDGEAADLGHCSWFGVECFDRKVVILNLRDLCLEGTIAPEIGKLTNVKFINLRNNSFYGIIPQEIGDLKKLEILDLGYNNFTGEFPSDLTLSILLLDNNNLLDNLSHKERKLLHVSSSPSSSRFPMSSISLPPSTTVSFISESPSTSPVSAPSPPPSLPTPPPISLSPAPELPEVKATLPPSPSSNPIFTNYKSKHHTFLIWSGVGGGSAFIFLSVFGFLFFKRNKVVTVKPWATGLSGQLQKAFTTGVPSLQRPELVTACEDFSNIIGSMIDGTVYKGTLSSGVEIAVTSTAIKSVKDWTKSLETQFRNKIEMLSKVNHKNFVNLIGYCEEQNPFTRMMVFEYAPNGTLFEHLHIKEAEHLDWSMRLRIAMGIAYCLEYLHQLNPPIIHTNLNSSSIYLTEDYAAKISDFSFWDTEKTGPTKTVLLETPNSSPQTNVYNFGLILFELITGKVPNRESDFSVDPSLSSFNQETVDELFQVVKSCVVLDLNQRPSMREVMLRLKEITAMAPESAIPRSSPLWWAELEILSSMEPN